MSEVSDTDIARICMLKGLNWSAPEIADKTGISKSTVYKYLNEIEDQSKAAEDPFRVFSELYLAHVFDGSFRENMAAMLQ